MSKISWSMEDIDSSDDFNPREEKDTSEIVVHADELEDSLIETQETERNIDNNDETIDSAIEVTEAIESLIDVINNSLSTGGLEKNAAAAVNSSLESYGTMLGVSSRHVIINESLEDFRGVGTRMAATQISLEGAKDLAKKAWDAIIQAIINSYQYIKNFIVQMFDSSVKLNKRVDYVIKIAKEKNFKPEQEKIKSKNFYNLFSVNGSYVGAVKSSEIIKDFANTFSSSWNPNKLSSVLLDISKDLTKEDLNNNDLISIKSNVEQAFSVDWAKEATNSTTANAILKQCGLQNDGSKSNAKVYLSEFLPHNSVTYLLHDWEISDNTTKNFIYQAGVFVQKTDNQTQEKEIQTLTQNDIIKVGENIKAAISKIPTIKQSMEKLNENKKQLQSSLKVLASYTNSNDSVVKRIMRFKKPYYTLVRTLDQPGLSVIKDLIWTSKVMIDFCEKSLSSNVIRG